jgi:transcriptional regulator with XRE-family HTH domain
MKARLEPCAVREGLFARHSGAYCCASQNAAEAAFRQAGSALMENMPQQQIETVRMAEIAQRLGVASSTISRALRNDPRISIELRKRVRSVADELGFRAGIFALADYRGEMSRLQATLHARAIRSRCAGSWRDGASGCRTILVSLICTERLTKWGAPPASTGISTTSDLRPLTWLSSDSTQMPPAQANIQRKF